MLKRGPISVIRLLAKFNPPMAISSSSGVIFERLLLPRSRKRRPDKALMLSRALISAFAHERTVISEGDSLPCC